MALDIYRTAVNIEGDGFELTLSQELYEEFEIDFPQHLGRFVAEVSQERDTVSGSWVEMANSLTRGSLCSSFSRSNLSIPMKLPQSMILIRFILILLVDAFLKTTQFRNFLPIIWRVGELVGETSYCKELEAFRQFQVQSPLKRTFNSNIELTQLITNGYVYNY
jgi:hypothetical protein